MKLRISLSAELTDEQILALRTHVLPLFTPLFSNEFKVGSKWYSRELDPTWTKKSFNRTRAEEKIRSALYYAARVATLLEIAVGKKGTPAQRAAQLHKNLGGEDYATKTIPPEKLFAGATLRMKNVLQVKGLLPEVKTAIQALLTSPYTKLMAKTWPYLVSELRTTIPALIKQYKLMAPPKSADKYYYQNDKQWPKIKERFIQYTTSLGFKEVPTTIMYDSDRLSVSMLRDDGVYLIGKPSECNPGYQIDGKGRYSWDRLGVDSGGHQWDSENNIEAVIDNCIDQCVVALEKRKHRDSNGTVVQFSSQKQQTLLPDELEAIIKALKEGRTHTIAPGGFGTAYIFSTSRRGFEPKLAAKDISDRVGSQVYYYTEDRD